jgi:hypothetical protein
MTAPVDVIVDRHDDIATVHAIRARRDAQSGTLLVSIPPAARSATEVVWAILRALGKRVASSRTTRSGGSTPNGG